MNAAPENDARKEIERLRLESLLDPLAGTAEIERDLQAIEQLENPERPDPRREAIRPSLN